MVLFILLAWNIYGTVLYSNYLNVLIAVISRHLEILPPLKSRRMFFCQLIPINYDLEISPHGKGSTAMYACAHALYFQTDNNMLIIGTVYAYASRSLQRPPLKFSHPWHVAAPNGAALYVHKNRLLVYHSRMLISVDTAPLNCRRTKWGLEIKSRGYTVFSFLPNSLNIPIFNFPHPF